MISPHKVLSVCACALAIAIPATADISAAHIKPAPQPRNQPEKPPASKNKAAAARCFGRIQFVNSGEDFRVKIIAVGIADLDVKLTPGVANKPGEWKIVDSAADYRVKIISDGVPDFTIRFTNSIPGLNP